MACAVGGALAAVLGGCQTQPLKITSFDSGVGAPYALRFTQYDIDIKWQVVSCGRATPSDPDKPFAVKAEVTADPKFPDDPSRRWRLDLWSLDGWANTTDASVTYEKGYFKSFNATVEDKSVETATALLGAGVKIAALAANFAPEHGVVRREPDACAVLVQAVKTAADDVKAKTSALATARAALLAAQAAQASGKVLRAREAAAEAAITNLETATDALAEAKKAVTVETKATWPKTGSDAPTTSLPLPADAIAQWKAQRWAAEAGAIAVAFDIRAIGANGELATITPVRHAEMDREIASGRIPVRVARPGALVATLTGVADKKPEEIYRKESAVIQSGDVIYVPVEYRWPRSTSSGFGIDGDGYLTTVSHKQTAAPGEAIGKLAGQFADTAKALKPSPLDKLKAENELLDAQKTNAELQKALHPEAKTEYELQLDALNADLAMKKAQLELLKTNAALAAGG